ncbi:hypothetical protein [Endozoicomonas sp.]|uniref:hypothetical protein n=1 Tax=Endozoicomonas sp. TaxID=1892382 RepID=UPI002883E35F|nr:hypothetical protein [Endozoicomonas sp.]
MSRNTAPGVDSQKDAGKDQPTIWGRIVKVAVPTLSIAGFITGIVLACTVAPIPGAVIAVASASVLIGKYLHDRPARRAPGVNPEITSPYVRKTVSTYRSVPLQSSCANELTHLPALDLVGELPRGASGARVYKVRGHNNNLMVLKIHRHAQNKEDPNFLWNEGRVQDQVSQGSGGLLPAVRCHGTIKGEKFTGLITDPSFIRADEKYSVILSDYIDHKSLEDLSRSSSEGLPSDVFRRALLDFARNMRDAVRKHQFEHNDLSRNLIYNKDGNIMLIDTGLSATRDYAFQGQVKGNLFMNIQAAIDIAYRMAGSNLNDPFYHGMKIGNDLNRYWKSVENMNDSVNFDLAEFNSLLLYFPDIRRKIIPGGHSDRARLLSWDECIAALGCSSGSRKSSYG